MREEAHDHRGGLRREQDGPRYEADRLGALIVFRRSYNTTRKCHTCNFRTHEPLKHEAHRQTVHMTYTQDDITRVIWPAIEGNTEKAIIYETDNDHFNIASWNGYYQDVVEEWDLNRRMARRADLITTSTPVLARRYSRFNPNVRVIRNAIDPDLYVRDTERPEGDKPRLVYYGSTARMRDYAGFPGIDGKWEGGYAAKAVEDNKHLLRRVFMGVDSGTDFAVSPLFDEMTPYIIGIPAFSKSLANMHGDIGIAPLHGDDFDRAKSELHWLEYAMSDMAFIGDELVKAMEAIEPAQKVALELRRDDKPVKLSVEARPLDRIIMAGHGMAMPGLPPMPPMHGMEMADTHWLLEEWGDAELVTLTPGLGRYFGADKGVLVAHAPEDSGFGLQDGDVIVAIGGREPQSGRHAMRILRSYQPGESVELRILRDRRTQTLNAKVPARSGHEIRRYRIAPPAPPMPPEAPTES